LFKLLAFFFLLFLNQVGVLIKKKSIQSGASGSCLATW
jgi:hypothetical protein